MSKKHWGAITPKRRRTFAPEVEGWLAQASEALQQKRYAAAIPPTRQVLAHPAASRTQRSAALAYQGIAQLMQQEFYPAYAALSAALRLTPDDPMLWYNRAIAGRFTMRMGQAVRDLEQALRLQRAPEQRASYAEELEATRQMAEQDRALRGPGFSLDQLIAQEDLFQQAVTLMEQQDWPAAAAVFRQVIEMGDCLPQPWGNLGMCLAMQRQFDEAEEALRMALEIDPDYALARQNLAALPALRTQEQLPTLKVTSPFDGKHIRKTLHLIEEP